MEGTYIFVVDVAASHDHTYYGNGCKITEYEGEGGSMESCSTRMIKTSDGEDQKNGTYYSFQASTSGSGAAITTDNTNTPDTFCPLGWQLPYSGTGGDYYNQSRSWRYLYNLYGYGSDASGEIGITSSPLSFVLSGFFSWGAGRLFRLDNNGTYWSMTAYTSTEAYSLGLYAGTTGTVNIAAGYAKNVGRALRCASGLATSKAFHGIRVHSLAFWLFIF